MDNQPIDPTMRYLKKTALVHGRRMAYLEAGEGDPIVFLHGNPTSSYLWRNIIPYLEGLGRCLAPDLIGMGDSEKVPPGEAQRYRFVGHRRYLDTLLEQLGVGEKVTLVIHDWGSALGFDWARRHPDSVKGLAYMEAIVRPVTWSEWPEAARSIIQNIRSPQGEELVLQKNLFLEGIFPASILRKLSPAEMEEYRRPFRRPGEDRRPTLTWPRDLPIEGQPPEVVQIVADYAAWLSQSQIPKLFFNAEPGGILIGPQREFCRAWPNQQEITIEGIHYIQEDAPHQIGRALAQWYQGL